MANSAARATYPKPVLVNIFCSQCDSQLGSFENEWTRLTSSYMRPAHPGQHIASEIAQKTQVVPNGVAQQAAEGCTMAEVFCKSCSTAVAQYCKAAPKPEQAQLLHQYFYKASRIYLQRTDNKLVVDPVFGFSGRSGRESGSFSVPPRPRLPSGLRLSQTPLRNSFTPSRAPLPSSEDRFQSRESSLFPNRPYTEPEESVEIQVAALSERLRYQEEKIAGHDQRNKRRDAQIQALAEELASFRGDLDDLRATAGDLQAQVQTHLPAAPDQTSFVSNLEHMCTLTKNVFSMSSEVERLRAENEALRAKLDGIKSPPGMSIAESRDSNALGKRKRNSGVAKSSRSHSNAINTNRSTSVYHDQASTRPILTPQSSIVSRHSSQASEQEDLGAASEEAAMDICFNGGVNDDGEGNMVDSASQDVTDTLLPDQEPVIQESDEAPEFAEKEPVGLDRSTTTRDVQGPEDGEASHLAYIEFSDEDELPSRPSKTGTRPGTESNDTATEYQPLEGGGVDVDTNGPLDDQEVAPAPSAELETVFKRPRRTMRSTSRRLTDYELEQNARSLAPEPVVRRRTLPRRLDVGGMEHVRIVTPTSLADEMNGIKKPRAERIMQSTEKILNHELTELGLEEWIGLKDKSTNAEYKKAVDEARIRQREKKRLAMLAKVGINLSPGSQQPRPPSSPAMDTILDERDQTDNTSPGEAMVGISDPILLTDRAQVDQPATQEPPAVKNKRGRKSETVEMLPEEEDPGMVTRRKQRRQEEIRRRDLLAQEALERDF